MCTPDTHRGVPKQAGSIGGLTGKRNQDTDKQRLGRVFMSAVTGVDHTALEMLGDKVLGSGGAVPHNDQIDLKRFDIFDRIEESFTFEQTARLRLHIDNVSTQALFGKFKRDPGTGTGFYEKVHNRHTAQSRNLFHSAFRNFFEFLRSIEDTDDLLGAQIIDTEQIFSCPLNNL